MAQFTLPADDPLRLRDARADIENQSKAIADNQLLVGVLDSYPGLVAVLNRHRQIVFANQAFLHFFGLEKPQDILGKRPGEALVCKNAVAGEFGCGTSMWCSSCGASQAILNCQEQGKEDVQECSLTHAVTGQALEFRVKATPLPESREGLLLLYLSDITDQQRRRALERIFFHDVMNTAGGVAGLSRVLGKEGLPAERKGRLLAMLQQNAERLVDEIAAQRQLTAAENNDLVVAAKPYGTMECLAWAASFYSHSSLCADCVVEIAPASADLVLVTDRHLVNRIVGNMVKNGVEAVAPQGAVRIGCTDHGEAVEFWVSNDGYIPAENQLHIFQRSFSTKGAGRGLGTYSIKLLGEHYLSGRVSFRSDPEQGTTFSFFLSKGTV
ncbi:MAG: ATP-binding protein [Desulfobulbaceae bacterium]|nr:ATP-binding protein [Desulfobulbaceae bacterium]